MDGLGIAGSHRAGPAMLARLRAANFAAEGFGLYGSGSSALSADPSAFLLGLRTLILIPRDIAEAEALLFETAALARRGKSVDTIAVAATLSPRYVRALRGRIRPSVALVDAPFAGSQRAAERGQLSFLFGGRAEDIDRLRPAFLVLGAPGLHMGGFGAAMAAKVLSDFMTASSAAMTRIALDWAEAQGIDESHFLEMTRASICSSALVQGQELNSFGSACPVTDPTMTTLVKEVETALDTALSCAHLTPPHAVENLVRNMRSRALH